MRVSLFERRLAFRTQQSAEWSPVAVVPLCLATRPKLPNSSQESIRYFPITSFRHSNKYSQVQSGKYKLMSHDKRRQRSMLNDLSASKTSRLPEDIVMSKAIDCVDIFVLRRLQRMWKCWIEIQYSYHKPNKLLFTAKILILLSKYKSAKYFSCPKVLIVNRFTDYINQRN